MPDERLNILIVDDDSLDRTASRRALLASGLHLDLTETNTRAGAVSALAEGAYDCALLDFQLPDGNGLDVLRETQALGVATPIVMLTGHGDELVAVELMKAGAADYLSKAKLTPESLARAVRIAIRVRRMEQQALRADDARLKSEAQFRRVAESNIIGILFWDSLGTITGTNDAFLEMIGYTRTDMEAGRVKWDVLALPEHDALTWQRVVELEAMGASVPFEKEYLRKDGSRIAIMLSASLLEGPEGLVLAFAVDVSERRRAEQAQQFLAEAGSILASSLNYSETLARVARLVVRHLADWCAIDLRDELGMVHRVAITHSDPEKSKPGRETGRHFPTGALDPDVVARVLETGKAEWATDIPEAVQVTDSIGDRRPEVPRIGKPSSYICVPLTVRGRVLGAITLLTAESGRRYTAADLVLVEDLARRTALAVDNARLFFETRARAERESVVNAIGRALRGSLDADEILEVATNEVGLHLGVSRCGWYWINTELEALEVAPQQYVAQEAEAFSGEFPLSLWGPGILGQWATGSPVISADCAHDVQVAAYRETFLSPMNIQAFIACPVFLRGAWAGLFVVHQTNAPRVWTVDEVTLLRQVADMLAPTLENARLFAREHRVADMLQAAFLSNVPDSLSGLSLGTVYRTGLEEAQVGGDFYDVFTLPDGRIGLVMGDVSGKGLSAAVLTATVKFSLRAFAAEVAAPSLVLTRLNHTLRTEAAGLGEHFVTLFYAVFDPISGRLAYASAGHETQIIKRAEGGTTLLEATGPILGITEHQFDQHHEHLAPGDSLILYTDGLTEARSPQTRELLDISRVVALIDALPAEAGAGVLAASVEQRALEWTSGRPQDDMALLVARRAEPDASGLPLLSRGETLMIENEPLSGNEELLFRFDFPSRPDYAAEVRQAVAHWMATLGFPREEVEDFQTAITEAVTNAVRHGSPRGASNQFQVIAYRLVDVAIAVDVLDSGPGLRTHQPVPVMPEPEATSGRGLPLMQELADAVQYVPTAKGMRVRLIKNRKAGWK